MLVLVLVRARLLLLILESQLALLVLETLRKLRDALRQVRSRALFVSLRFLLLELKLLCKLVCEDQTIILSKLYLEAEKSSLESMVTALLIVAER